MILYEPLCRTLRLIDQLTDVWEASVRATHHFLTGAEIERIRAYVPQALRDAAHLIVAENENGEPVAFMGLNGTRLEMLFIAPAERGAGLGRRLIEYGIRQYALNETTVNEQNTQEAGFYRHMGFEPYRRTEFDEEGGPYPLLYMRLKKQILGA